MGQTSFECPKCPFVAPDWRQLEHHMVTNAIHGRAEGNQNKPGRPKKMELEMKGNFR